ncbi:glycosyltransferase family 2 protein [Tersicoccus phoenicis]|uniref:glycosyltransferase family 2 protein n=1 Tax=Tersicoccus phoenicis TaxID=554083 RepID=UPI001180EB5B|nr:glycosyltransferase family 2 protein [Tersicoccus phoenicis]
MEHVIVTMSRGDAPRLAEWVTYHQDLGFDEFYVVLDHPVDDSAEILRGLPGDITVDERGPYREYWDDNPPANQADRQALESAWRDENGEDIVRWKLPIVDALSYRQLLYLAGVLNLYAVRGDCWVSVLDVDEFLVLPGGGSIQDLTAGSDAPRLRFKNYNFDTSAWRPGASVLGSSVKRWHQEDIDAYGHGWDRRVKAIVRHDALLPFASVHAISRGQFIVVDPEVGRLHHYRVPDQALEGLPYRVTDTAAAERAQRLASAAG